MTIALSIYCGITYTLGFIMYGIAGRYDRIGDILIVLTAPISIPISLVYEIIDRWKDCKD